MSTLGMSMFRRTIEQHIAESGVSIIGVPGTRTEPSFAYTIGMTALYGCEVIVFGLPMEHAHVILNDVFKAGTPELGVPTDQFTNLPVLFKLCNKNTGVLHSTYVVQADAFYGREVSVVQMILSDREGRTPLDADYDHEYMSRFQPLFVNF